MSGSLHLGIIGCGNMGSALGRGVLQKPALRKAFTLHIYDSHTPSMAHLAGKRANTATSPLELAQNCDLVLLAVKPYQVMPLLLEIAPALAVKPSCVISIAAGVTLGHLRDGLNTVCPVVRVMPNTPAMVGEGFFGICFDRREPIISDTFKQAVRTLFSGLGRTLELGESSMNAFTALSGSGPAYVLYFLESLVEAGVSVGLPRESAHAISLSLLKGGLALVESTGQHPAVLREQVCSPAGTTIAAMNHLDRCAVRGHIIDAVQAAMERGREMEEEV